MVDIVKKRIIRGFGGEVIGTQPTIGGVPVSKATFVTGGGGGFIGPIAPPKKSDAQKLAEEIQQRAEAEKVSFEIAQARTRSEETRRLIEKSRSLGRDIDTPVQQRLFFQEFGREVTKPTQKTFLGVGGGIQLISSKDVPRGRGSFGVPVISEAERRRGNIGFVPVDIKEETPLIFSPQRTAIERSLGVRTKESAIITQKDIFRAEMERDIVKDVEKKLEIDPSSFLDKKGVVGRSTQEGEEITLTPEFFKQEFADIDKQSTIKAKEFFEGFTPERKFVSKTASQIKGLSSIGIGIGEFGVQLVSSLGVQQLDPTGEKQKKFEFGGELGKIRTSFPFPTTTTFLEDPVQFVKEKAESPALVTEIVGTAGLITLGGSGLLKNIKKGGVIGGLVETGSLFTPLRIQPKVFVAPITSEVPIRATSLKLDVGDLRVRTIVGKGRQDPFTLTSKQITRSTGGREFGITETEIFQPATILKQGRFIEGIQLSQFRGFTGARGGGRVIAKIGDLVKVDLPGIKSGKSISLTQQKFGGFFSKEFSAIEIFPKSPKFKVGKGGGVSFKLDEGITKFGFGKSKPIFETELFGDIGIRRPSGKVKFKPTTIGKEFDLNKLLKQPEFFGGRLGGGRKTPLSKTFGKTDLGLQQQLSTIRTSLGVTKPPRVTTKAPVVSELLGIPRSVGGSGLTEQQLAKGVGSQVFETSTINLKSDLSIPALNIQTLQSGFQLPKQRQELKSIVSPFQPEKIGLRQPQRQEFVQLSKTLQKQQTKQIARQKVRSGFDPFAFDPLGFGVGFGPAPFFPPLFPSLGKAPTRRKLKKRRKRRVPIRPSLTGILTGFEAPAFTTQIGGVDLGILPGQIRGTRTGLAPPRRRKKIKKKKK